jgi:hypothetical protein
MQMDTDVKQLFAKRTSWVRIFKIENEMGILDSHTRHGLRGQMVTRRGSKAASQPRMAALRMLMQVEAVRLSAKSGVLKEMLETYQQGRAKLGR